MPHFASIVPQCAAIFAPLAAHPSLVARAAGLALVAALSLPATSAEFAARNAAEVKAATDRTKPGDVVVLENGSWRDQVIEFAGEGAPNKPIVLRARTPGGVKLEGSSRLEISGRYLQVEGLRFEGGALTDGQAIVQFRGRKGEASNSRLTESAIVRYNPQDPKVKYAWVALYGTENRVDHNRFEGQAHAGVTVVVFRRPKKVDKHLIDDNYFVDRPPGSGNGYEAIRVGTSQSASSISNTRIERNLFERTDGEVETVSIKSGGNVIRENTFREVAGTLTLRHGNGNIVEQNYFLGGHKPGTGGIRVTGEDHVVRGNVLQEIEGRVGGVISLMCAKDKPGPEVDYEPLHRLELRGNVITESNAPAIKVDAGCGSTRKLRPSGVTVSENIVTGSKAAATDGQAGAGWSWKDNRFAGERGAPAEAAGVVSRSAGSLGPGADGVWRTAESASSVGPTKPPLTSKDVGPAWLR